MDPPTHQLAQVPTKAGLLPDKNMPPSWAGRPSSFRVVVAELAVICVPYFLIRFFALPTFWLYHAPLSSLWHDIIVVPWTWIKTFNTFINSEGDDSDFLDQIGPIQSIPPSLGRVTTSSRRYWESRTGGASLMRILRYTHTRALSLWTLFILPCSILFGPGACVSEWRGVSELPSFRLYRKVSI